MTRFRARNWAKDNRALVNRGSIIFWVEQASLKKWHAEQSKSPGRPQVYSDQAILALLIVRHVFHCGFRQLQGFMRDILKLMGTGLICPDYTTICRRARSLKVPFKVHRKGPLYIVFDSTGLKVFGEGEWLARKWGVSHRRGWRKIHIGMCVQTQQVVVASMTRKGFGDSQALPAMLDCIDGEIKEVIGDGAYDTGRCYEAIYKRGAKPIIPPRKGARKSNSRPSLEARNAAIDRIRDQKRGLRRWKREVNYHRRSLVETAMHRLKSIMGPKIRARRVDSQGVEVSVKLLILNRMMAEMRG